LSLAKVVQAALPAKNSSHWYSSQVPEMGKRDVEAVVACTKPEK